MLSWTGSAGNLQKKRELRGAWKSKERLLGEVGLQGDPRGWVRCEQSLKRPEGRSFISQRKGKSRRSVAIWQEKVRGPTWVSPGSGAHSWMAVSSWLPSAGWIHEAISYEPYLLSRHIHAVKLLRTQTTRHVVGAVAEATGSLPWFHMDTWQ